MILMQEDVENEYLRFGKNKHYFWTLCATTPAHIKAIKFNEIELNLFILITG
jgi:hypothetical protein